MKGFLYFIRTQGVIGLAIGFIIGAEAQQFVSALSSGLIDPIVSAATGRFGDLANASSTVASITFGWGQVVSALINLLLVAFIVYLAITFLRAKELDAPKESK